MTELIGKARLVSKNPDIAPFISLKEAMANARIEELDESTVVESIMDAAITYVEECSGRALNKYTYDLVLSCAPSSQKICLPHAPASELVSISYFDEANISQSLSVQGVTFRQTEDESSITPLGGQSWPVLYDRSDALTIRYTTGYPRHIKSPANLKQAALLLITHWYDHRSAVDMVKNKIPYGVENLINLSKKGWF